MSLCPVNISICGTIYNVGDTMALQPLGSNVLYVKGITVCCYKTLAPKTLLHLGAKLAITARYKNNFAFHGCKVTKNLCRGKV